MEAEFRMPSISVIRFIYAAALFTCAIGDTGAQERASDAGQICTNVYLIDSGNRFINPPNTYTEVSFATDDSGFVVKGKLASFDWGAFPACGKELKLRFRGLSDTIRAVGPAIHESKKEYWLHPHAKNVYFGLRGWGYKEITSNDGEKAIAAINSRRSTGPVPPTGWEWIDRRELYYGRGSKCFSERSELCP